MSTHDVKSIKVDETSLAKQDNAKQQAENSHRTELGTTLETNQSLKPLRKTKGSIFRKKKRPNVKEKVGRCTVLFK